MAILNENDSVGPAHDAGNAFMGGCYRACGMKIADGTVPHIAKGGAAEIAWYGETRIGITCCNAFSNIVDGECVSLTIEDTPKRSPILGVRIVSVANHHLCITEVNVGSHLGVYSLFHFINQHGKSSPIIRSANQEISI